jgi:hypothetical protein
VAPLSAVATGLCAKLTVLRFLPNANRKPTLTGKGGKRPDLRKLLSRKRRGAGSPSALDRLCRHEGIEFLRDAPGQRASLSRGFNRDSWLGERSACTLRSTEGGAWNGGFMRAVEAARW